MFLFNPHVAGCRKVRYVAKPERIFHSDADGIKLLTVVAVPEVSVNAVGPCRVIHIPNSLILESGNFPHEADFGKLDKKFVFCTTVIPDRLGCVFCPREMEIQYFVVIYSF